MNFSNLSKIDRSAFVYLKDNNLIEELENIPGFEEYIPHKETGTGTIIFTTNEYCESALRQFINPQIRISPLFKNCVLVIEIENFDFGKDAKEWQNRIKTHLNKFGFSDVKIEYVHKKNFFCVEFPNRETTEAVMKKFGETKTKNFFIDDSHSGKITYPKKTHNWNVYLTITFEKSEGLSEEKITDIEFGEFICKSVDEKISMKDIMVKLIYTDKGFTGTGKITFKSSPEGERQALAVKEKIPKLKFNDMKLSAKICQKQKNNDSTNHNHKIFQSSFSFSLYSICDPVRPGTNITG